MTEINWEQETKEISTWMKNYLVKANKDGYIIGLSGGLDSAVVAVLAVKAVGKENIWTTFLDCDSNPQDEKDAVLIAHKLDVPFTHIDIKTSYEETIDCLPICPSISQITLDNIKARLRMIFLYTIAGEKNYLVAGTSNLSELELGYFTKYGDGGVDIEPIGNYYKTEIKKIAQELKIPSSIIEKAPSAGLHVGQTDEKDLGLSYEQIDPILHWIKTGEETKTNIMNVPEIINTYGKDNIKKIIKIRETGSHKNNLPPRYKRKNETIFSNS